ncbi:hypothetical protein CHS0354_029645 [Potamilus streckersoni]|uniref:Heme-binding protein 2 n=1 Tax=Potamilus streckersoni TaxID=2493646 RepID=A0AAE0RTG8_9BIVA|nr:hypothetical protein CHS0354_029645 [Potamilus streckersoni]
MQDTIYLLCLVLHSCQLATVSSEDILKYLSKFPVSKPDDSLMNLWESEVKKIVGTDNDGILLQSVPVGAKWPPPFCHKLKCPYYDLLESTEDYELRRYNYSLWVTTNVAGIDFKQATYEAFMRLFKYIQGNNEKGIKIEMTVPVTTKLIPGPGPACENNFTMSFFVDLDMGFPPRPNDTRVLITRTPPNYTVYVRSFSGFTPSEERWTTQAEALYRALSKKGHSFETEYYFTAGYDSPFRIFNRHNEIWFLKK